MSNEAVILAPQKGKIEKGRLAWVVPVFEVVVAIGFALLAWSAIEDALDSFNLEQFCKDIRTAMYFLVACTVISVAMCFVPLFKSKSNYYIAIGNIVWLAFLLYGSLG